MDLAGVAVCVAGAGVTGRSVAAALVGMGAQVTVTDANAERLAELGDLGVRLVARPRYTARMGRARGHQSRLASHRSAVGRGGVVGHRGHR